MKNVARLQWIAAVLFTLAGIALLCAPAGSTQPDARTGKNARTGTGQTRGYDESSGSVTSGATSSQSHGIGRV